MRTMLVLALLGCGTEEPAVEPPRASAPPPEVAVRYRVESQSDPAPQGTDQETIAAVVKRSQGRITSCLEQALMANPSFSGKVSVGWNIVSGRVQDAHLVKNTTGDDAFGKCVVNAVRQFRFPAELNAEVAEFPWVVSGQ